MKKLLSIIIAACMLPLAGCSGNTSSASSASSASLTSSASSALPKTSITIAAAASLTDVSKEIQTAYNKVQPNVTLTFTYGASGALQTQIEQGAPVDAFISAATKQMDALDKKGLISTGTRVNLLENKLVLITPKNSILGIKSFADVANANVKKVALGDPASVPAGQYAQQVFTYLKSWNKVKVKANYGTDVRQVLTWVESGNVDCGVVYATDALTDSKVTVVCEAPTGSYSKIVYPAAVIKKSANAEAAENFIKFMQSADAAAIFKKYGFTMA